MPSIAHYPGDKVAQFDADKAAGRLFGPDICGPVRPGQILGFGAHYEVDTATYDVETDRTTVKFTPYVPPRERGRIRYHGAADGEPEHDMPDVGTPTLADRDTIAGR